MNEDRSELATFLKDAKTLAALPQKKRFKKLELFDYPYDLELLGLSRIYRKSRKSYLDLGGEFFPRISSTMRSLSSQDLFANEIDYTPSRSELVWFTGNIKDVSDPIEEMSGLAQFNVISVFHEQNHRIIWQLLPPAPREQRDLCRYLNFAESLVVMLDLALGDELGAKLSPIFERMKITYRPGHDSKWRRESKSSYRRYLLAMLATTYYVLELINPEDILKAVDYVFPGQKKMNKEAVNRGLNINELFTRITNPQWQERYWKTARTRLGQIHTKSLESPFYVPEDPLDIEEEFVVAGRVLDHFGL